MPVNPLDVTEKTTKDRIRMSDAIGVSFKPMNVKAYQEYAASSFDQLVVTKAYRAFKKKGADKLGKRLKADFEALTGGSVASTAYVALRRKGAHTYVQVSSASGMSAKTTTAFGVVQSPEPEKKPEDKPLKPKGKGPTPDVLVDLKTRAGEYRAAYQALAAAMKSLDSMDPAQALKRFRTCTKLARAAAVEPEAGFPEGAVEQLAKFGRQLWSKAQAGVIADLIARLDDWESAYGDDLIVYEDLSEARLALEQITKVLALVDQYDAGFRAAMDKRGTPVPPNDELANARLDFEEARRQYMMSLGETDLSIEEMLAGLQMDRLDTTIALTVETLRNDRFQRMATEVMEQGTQDIGELGTGGFGTVMLVQSVDGVNKLALKTSDPFTEYSLENEVSLYEELGPHPNIGRCGDLTVRDTKKCLVLEYYAGGDAGSAFDKAKFALEEGRLSVTKYWGAVQHMLRGMCRGLAHMESKGFAHLDMKPDNVLIDPTTGEVRLIDLGAGRAVGKFAGMGIGTVGFADEQATVQSGQDSFGLGASAYKGVEEETFDYKRTYAFPDAMRNYLKSADEAIEVVKKYEGKAGTAGVRTAYVDFVNQLMAPRIEDRMTPSEALSHAFLKDPILPEDEAKKALLEVIGMPRKPKPAKVEAPKTESGGSAPKGVVVDDSPPPPLPEEQAPVGTPDDPVGAPKGFALAIMNSTKTLSKTKELAEKGANDVWEKLDALFRALDGIATPNWVMHKDEFELTFSMVGDNGKPEVAAALEDDDLAMSDPSLVESLVDGVVFDMKWVSVHAAFGAL